MLTYPNFGLQSSYAGSGGLYAPHQTRAATNQAVADAYANSQYYDTRKSQMAPGRSMGASSQRNLLPQAIAGRVNAANATAMTPFQDAKAGAQFDLANQVAREGEALGWAGLGVQDQSTAFSNQQRQRQMGWSLLNQIMGW